MNCTACQANETAYELRKVEAHGEAHRNALQVAHELREQHTCRPVPLAF